MNDMSDDDRWMDTGDWIECWQCGGCGATPGCFEDCCSGADCDPDNAEYCCAPSRCDVCRGKGGWKRDEEAKTPALPSTE